MSVDFSDISSVSDVIDKLQMFNLDVVTFAQENVGVLMSVGAISNTLVGLFNLTNNPVSFLFLFSPFFRETW